MGLLVALALSGTKVTTIERFLSRHVGNTSPLATLTLTVRCPHPVQLIAVFNRPVNCTSTITTTMSTERKRA